MAEMGRDGGGGPLPVLLPSIPNASNDPLTDPEYSNWRRLWEGSKCAACHVTHDGYLDDGRIPDNSQLDPAIVNYYRSLDPVAQLIHAYVFYLLGGLGSWAPTTPEAPNRAVELQNALKTLKYPHPFNMTTTAVLTTDEGVTLVASSEGSLAQVQLDLLLPNEIDILGQEGIHAEKKLILAATSSNLTPNAMFVSRTVCPTCQAWLEYFNIPFFQP